MHSWVRSYEQGGPADRSRRPRSNPCRRNPVGAPPSTEICVSREAVGRFTSSSGPGGGRAMNLQDDCGASHGSVLVHGDLLAGLDVRPVGGGEGHEANRGSAAGLQMGHIFNPERGNADRTSTGRREVADVPHGPQNTGAGDWRRASPLSGRTERQVRPDHAVADFGAPPMTPGRAPLLPKLLSRFGELFPKSQRERATVAEFLQQAQGDLPLVVDEVVSDVSHRDVVLGGGLFRNQQRS